MHMTRIVSFTAVLLTTGCASLPGVYKLPAAPAGVAASPASAEEGVVAPAGPEAPGALPPSTTGAVAPAVAVVGALAPDAAFLDGDGRRHLLSEFKGKFLALVFFAHW